MDVSGKLPMCNMQNHREARDEPIFLVWGAGSEGVLSVKTENREGAGLYGKGEDLSLGCVALGSTGLSRWSW